MNKTVDEALAYVDDVIDALPVPGVEVFLLPAHTALATVHARTFGRAGLRLGAQNAHWEPEGSGATGEVSMRMVASAGAELVEIGHSERRARFAETDETVARKVRAALAEGLVPLVCVGEDRAARRAGRAERVVVDQLRSALGMVDQGDVDQLLVAYEPLWAIGAEGEVATPEQVAPIIDRLRALSTAATPDGHVLYGGSVDPSNAGALLEVADGLFVGRAAWTAAGFRALVAIAGDHAARTS